MNLEEYFARLPLFGYYNASKEITKFNPYHDERGRFTSANRSSGYAVKRQAAWQGLPSKISRSVKIRSAEQAGIKVSSQAEKILEEGPKGRLSTNSRTGHAQIIPRSAAKRMFGSTNEEVAGYIKKNFGITVDHSNSHPATYHAMLGVAQALTEIKASLKPSQRKLLFGKNGSLRKMKMSVDDPSGIAWYDNYKNQISLSPQAFTDIAIEAVQYGGAPSRASGKWRDAVHYVSLTSQKRTARSIPDAVRALGYAVTVHEVGHAIQQALERSSSRRYSPAGVGSTQYSSLSRKVARVSQYAYSDKYESFAESFAAWHLLSGSKSSAVQARLASPDMASLAQYALAQIAKAMMEKKITQMPAVLAWFTEYLGTYDPNISKFNPHHDELGRFTSASQAVISRSGRNKEQKAQTISTKNTLDSDYLTPSGYGAMPTPTDDLAVAKETGAPIRWLMPNSMAEPIAKIYDKFVSERSNTRNENPPDPNDFAQQLVRELTKFGFSETDASIVAEGISFRAIRHAKERAVLQVPVGESLVDYALGGASETQRWNNQTSRSVFGDIGDEFVGVHVPSFDTMKKIIDDGRYKTQFETETSGGLLDTRARARQEVAMFSIHPSVSPEKRPVYGQVYPDGFQVEAWKSAGQYGQIVLVLKKSAHSKTSWNSGDSLGNTTQSSSLKKPTYHGGEPEPEVEYLTGGSSLNYVEAQIHGGLKASDISHIIIPTDRGLGPKRFRQEFGIPSSIKIVNVSSLAEGENVHKAFASNISLEAVLAATSTNCKLYVLPKENSKGYVEFDDGSVFSVNPQDVYSRGYWKLNKTIEKANPYHDERGRFTSRDKNSRGRTSTEEVKVAVSAGGSLEKEMMRTIVGLRGNIPDLMEDEDQDEPDYSGWTRSNDANVKRMISQRLADSLESLSDEEVVQALISLSPGTSGVAMGRERLSFTNVTGTMSITGRKDTRNAILESPVLMKEMIDILKTYEPSSPMRIAAESLIQESKGKTGAQLKSVVEKWFQETEGKQYLGFASLYAEVIRQGLMTTRAKQVLAVLEKNNFSLVYRLGQYRTNHNEGEMTLYHKDGEDYKALLQETLGTPKRLSAVRSDRDTASDTIVTVSAEDLHKPSVFDREQIASSVLRGWADSSGSPRSVALAKIIQKEFRTGGTFTSDDTAGNYSPAGKKALGLMAKAMYKDTQDMFKKMGVKKIVLFRGFSDTTGGIVEAAIAQSPSEIVSLRNIQTRPISSWTTDWLTAGTFYSEQEIPILATRVIDVKDIFSTALTGLGALTEFEVVAMAPKKTATSQIVASRHYDVITEGRGRKDGRLFAIDTMDKILDHFGLDNIDSTEVLSSVTVESAMS